VKDINSDGTIVEYLNGPGIDNKIRQKGSSNSTTYYFSQDHLGSTTALTGTTGKLIERVTYDAYGNSTGSTRTRYGFTGRERDSLTSLLYYRARFYDLQLGRFISEDPIGFDGKQENFYAYVANNPVSRKDPDGLDIAVIENGPTSYTPFSGGNPVGHTGIAISCHGVYSFGNGTKRGSSLLEYLRREAPKRNTRIYVIKTTCDQSQSCDAGNMGLRGYPARWCAIRQLLISSKSCA
jgi:RHS repeat-associated protein